MIFTLMVFGFLYAVEAETRPKLDSTCLTGITDRCGDSVPLERPFAIVNCQYTLGLIPNSLIMLIEVTETNTIVLRASTFEVDSGHSTSQAGRAVSGFIGVDDEDEKILEALKSLCEKENVDKVIIVYRNYEFELVGVSLSTRNSNPPRIHIRKNKQYRFQARDIGLAALHKSAVIDEKKAQSLIDQ